MRKKKPNDVTTVKILELEYTEHSSTQAHLPSAPPQEPVWWWGESWAERMRRRWRGWSRWAEAERWTPAAGLLSSPGPVPAASSAPASSTPVKTWRMCSVPQQEQRERQKGH